MSLALRPEYRIVVRRGSAAVIREQDRCVVAHLSRAEAVALALLDGTRAPAEVERVLAAAHGAGASAAVRAVTRLAPLLSTLPPGARPPSLRALGQAAAVAPLPPRAPGPRVLHWWVTHECPRRCAYCFARPRPPGSSAGDPIDRKRLQILFAEAARLGADRLLLSGGEPLLRRDLPEIIGDAVRQGIVPHLATKYPIASSLARRLSRSGLPHVTLSLDTVDARVNASLVGDARFAERVRASARNLRACGVPFSVQAVVTASTRRSLSALARAARAMGAAQLQLVPLEAPANGAGPTPISARTLRELARRLGERAGLPVHAFDASDSSVAPGACDVGVTKLFFLPDGAVHRCHRLAHLPELRGPSLRTTSIAALWNGSPFRRWLAGAGTRGASAACIWKTPPPAASRSPRAGRAPT